MAACAATVVASATSCASSLVGGGGAGSGGTCCTATNETTPIPVPLAWRESRRTRSGQHAPGFRPGRGEGRVRDRGSSPCLACFPACPACWDSIATNVLPATVACAAAAGACATCCSGSAKGAGLPPPPVQHTAAALRGMSLLHIVRRQVACRACIAAPGWEGESNDRSGRDARPARGQCGQVDGRVGPAGPGLLRALRGRQHRPRDDAAAGRPRRRPRHRGRPWQRRAGLGGRGQPARLRLATGLRRPAAPTPTRGRVAGRGPGLAAPVLAVPTGAILLWPGGWATKLPGGAAVAIAIAVLLAAELFKLATLFLPRFRRGP